jgi:hypothetical protein
MEKRDTFIFYRSIMEAAQVLEDSDKVLFYEAVMKYSFDFKEPKLDGIPQALFTLVKPTLSKSNISFINGSKPKASKSEANDKQKESKSEANQKPTANNKDKDKDKDTIANDFELFWSHYPKKVSKGSAEKAFKKHYKSLPEIKKLIEILDAKKKSEAWTKDNGQYIPHAATWLNAKGWEDEVQPVNNTQQGGRMMGGYYV